MTVPQDQEQIKSYQQALTLPYYRLLSEPVCLLLKGPDRVAFLQRQTTNDVRLLSSDRSVLTVLTSPTARILDVFRLIHQEDAIQVLTLPGSIGRTSQYLKSRIFFMDQVTIQDNSSDLTQIFIEGALHGEIWEKLGVHPDASMGQVIHTKLDGVDTRAVIEEIREIVSLRLLIPTPSTSIVLSFLENLGVRTIPEETYEIMRIEKGIPRAHIELTDEYTPLEMKLDLAISEDKGCYTGQEIIARQLTYGKVTRRLVGLSLDSEVSPGTKIKVNHAPIGEITSVTCSPRLGWIALAVIKQPYFEEGTSLIITTPDNEVEATVCALPFFTS